MRHFNEATMKSTGQNPATARHAKLDSRALMVVAIFIFSLGTIASPVGAQNSTVEIVQPDTSSSSSKSATLEIEPQASATPLADAAKSQSSKPGGTRVPVPTALTGLLNKGGVPSDLDQLKLLEDQQRAVAEKAARCTVSVRIGPAQGCGVIITGTGYIVTAAHVAMRPGKKAIVTLSNGRQIAATTLGMNRRVDAGLIRIDPDQNGDKPWPHASLGTSKGLVEGMWCIAMGHPGGYDVGRGPVIRVGRLLRVKPEVILTDCALIGGDSGGPLFNLAGDLIAVHSRIGNDVSENLHVPIDHYDYAWDRMASGESWGFLPHFKPTLGVTGNQRDTEARIIAVTKNSAAEKGGLLPNDVVERFGEKIITNFQSLKDAVSDTMPGERVKIIVRRDDKRVMVQIEIGRSS